MPHPVTEWTVPGLGIQIDHCDLLFEQQSEFQHIEVYQSPALGRFYRLDGCMMASEADEWLYHENLTHLAAATLGAPKSALILGGGDGGSARQLLKYASIQTITLCELDASVLSMAREYLSGIHHGALDDPRVHIEIGDGFAYVAQLIEKKAHVDLIILDLTDPQGHAEPLYTAEFFRQCATLLGHQGMISLHVGAPIYQAEQCQRIIANLRQAFPVVRPYLVPIVIYGGLWCMACASTSHRTDPASLPSDAVDVRLALADIGDLHYYNGATHVGALALPNFVRSQLKTTDSYLPWRK
jgi:spermidine synthase